MFYVQELVELGVQKVGHRKKILAALTNITARDHLFSTKPVRTCILRHPNPHPPSLPPTHLHSSHVPFTPQTSISEWLSSLGLAQYEPVLLDAGYDDIDFISDITAEELRDINITIKGEPRLRHVRCICMVWYPMVVGENILT